MGDTLPGNGGDRRGISAPRLQGAFSPLPPGLSPAVLSLIREWKGYSSLSQPFMDIVKNSITFFLPCQESGRANSPSGGRGYSLRFVRTLPGKRREAVLTELCGFPQWAMQLGNFPGDLGQFHGNFRKTAPNRAVFCTFFPFLGKTIPMCLPFVCFLKKKPPSCNGGLFVSAITAFPGRTPRSPGGWDPRRWNRW